MKKIILLISIYFFINEVQASTKSNIINNLKNVGYEGWFVVEAEQDPKICPPLEYAKIGYKSLSDYLIRAGYEIDNYFLGK